MKAIVTLLNELKPLSSFEFAEQFGLHALDVAAAQKIDFDNWLRRCAHPGKQFSNLEDAYAAYIRSFG
jgi:hypothetical protein